MFLCRYLLTKCCYDFRWMTYTDFYVGFKSIAVLFFRSYGLNCVCPCWICDLNVWTNQSISRAHMRSVSNGVVGTRRTDKFFSLFLKCVNIHWKTSVFYGTYFMPLVFKRIDALDLSISVENRRISVKKWTADLIFPRCVITDGQWYSDSLIL